MKRKVAAVFLAMAMSISFTACSNDNANSGASNANSGASADSVSDDTDFDSDAQDAAQQLSNPVKFNDDGDIDMDAALSYETDFDSLKASLSQKTVDLDKPVSENAQKNENTMEIFNYLRSIYGKQILSGQQQDDVYKIYEDKVYYLAAEDLPALRGFDFIFCTGSYINTSMVDAAVEWGKENGGLVTFMWHWNVPCDVDDLSKGYAFYQEEITNFNPLNATTPGTKEYEVAVHDIDMIASYLQRLEQEGITVLFRPFHEASGSWFWWGIQDADKKMIKDGTYPETYQRLWYMMFDRLENYHKLSNLIWVWNGQTRFCEVDPNTYDISGVDYYAETDDHTPLVSEYEKLSAYTYEGKMLALTECGNIPDPQQCADKDTMWLYYLVWNGGFVYETMSGMALTDIYGTPRPNPERLSEELIKEYFSNDALVTWGKLPQFRTGSHNVPQAITTWNYFRTEQ